MTEPSGDPVEQLAARQAGVVPVREFADKAKPVDLGDPALDPVGTLRIEPGKHGRIVPPLHVGRVVRTTSRVSPWVGVSGPVAGAGFAHDNVADWPRTSYNALQAAALLAAEQAPHEGAVQPAGRGDMDVDAFAPTPRRAR